MSFETRITGLLTGVGPSRWKFGESVGSTTLADATGNGRAGTVHGSVTLGIAGFVPNQGGNTALQTGGNDTDYVDFGNILPTSGTLGCFFETPGNDPNVIGAGLRMMFGQQGGANLMNYHGAGDVGAWSYGDSAYRGTSQVITDAALHFVAVVYQLGVAGGSQIYVDGAAVGGTITLTGSGSGLPLRLGASNFPGQAATIKAQEAFMTPVALTATDIGNLWTDAQVAVTKTLRLDVPAIGLQTQNVSLSLTADLGNLANQSFTITHTKEDGTTIGTVVGGDTQTAGTGASKSITFTCPAVDGPIIFGLTNSAGLKNEMAYPGGYHGAGFATLQVQKYAAPLRTGAYLIGAAPGTFDLYTGRRSHVFYAGETPKFRLYQGSGAANYRVRRKGVIVQEAACPSTASTDQIVTLTSCTDQGSYKVDIFSNTVDATYGQCICSGFVSVVNHSAHLPDFPTAFSKRDDSAPGVQSLPGDFGGTGTTYTNQTPVTGSASSPYTSPFFAVFDGTITPPNSGGTAGTNSFEFRIANTGGYRMTVNGVETMDNLTNSTSFDVTSGTIPVTLTGGAAVNFKYERNVIMPSGTYSGDTMQYRVNGGAWNALPNSWFNNHSGTTAGNIPVTYYPPLVPYTSAGAGQIPNTDVVAHQCLGGGILRLEIHRLTAPEAEWTQWLSTIAYINGFTQDAARPSIMMGYVVWYRRRTFTVGSSASGTNTVHVQNQDLFATNSKVTSGDGHVYTVASVNRGTNIVTLTTNLIATIPDNTDFYDNPADADAKLAWLAGQAVAVGVTMWSLWNEPDVLNDCRAYDPVQAASDFVTGKNALRNTGAGGSATAKLAGPGCNVTFPQQTLTPNAFLIPWLNAMQTNGTLGTIDAFCWQGYHFHDGELAQGRKQAAWLINLLTTYGLQSRPKYQVEQSYPAMLYGSFHINHQPHNEVIQRDCYEQVGIPSKNDYWWRQRYDGFGQFPHQWEMADASSSLLPTALVRRNFEDRVYGKQFSAAYDFGSENAFIIGSLFSDGGTGRTARFLAPGNPEVSIMLTAGGSAGDGTLHTFDEYGKQTNISSSGVVTIPIGPMPTYVDLQPGQTIAVIPAAYGTNVASAGSGGTISTSGSPSGTGQGFTSSIAVVNNGTIETHYVGDGDPWVDGVPSLKPSDFPVSIEVDFTAQSLSRMKFKAPAPWQLVGTPIDITFQARVAGAWTTQLVKHKTPVEIGVTTPPAFSSLDVWWDEQSVFDATFAPVIADAARVLINRSSMGGHAGRATLEAGGQGLGFPGAAATELMVFPVSAPATPSSSMFRHPGMTGGLVG